jgi:mRNA-degrading endonuclease HigB of HigAB toxin-antitoxin module
MPKYIDNFSNILKMDSNVLRFLVLINNYNFIKNILIKLFVIKENYDSIKSS